MSTETDTSCAGRPRSSIEERLLALAKLEKDHCEEWIAHACGTCDYLGKMPVIRLPDGRSLRKSCAWCNPGAPDSGGDGGPKCVCEGRGWVVDPEVALWRLVVWFFDWYAQAEPGYSNMTMFIARARLVSVPEATLEAVENVLGATEEDC